MNDPGSKIALSQSHGIIYAFVILVSGFLYSCDDSSSGPSTETLTVLGTTRATGPTTCTTHLHPFQAGEGPVTVTLVESTANTSLAVQVCAGGIDNNNCTINQTSIGVGQNVSGTRIGIAAQVLAFEPLNCGGGPTAPINYTATVTFSRP
jgi:hypothetical protein